jgi:hypothetical protein
MALRQQLAMEPSGSGERDFNFDCHVEYHPRVWIMMTSGKYYPSFNGFTVTGNYPCLVKSNRSISFVSKYRRYFFTILTLSY